MSEAASKTPDLREVERLASTYAQRRTDLSNAVALLEQAVDEVKRMRLSRIKALVIRAVDARDKLQAEIARAAEVHLFEKPKTRTFAGIRVGLKKAKDTVEIDDEGRVIARIRATVPKDQAELLISVKESVDKAAVRDLLEEDIKRLGIRLVKGEDQVMIKPQDSDVAKLVDSLIGKGEELEVI